MSIRSETYAKDLMSHFQYCDGVPARRRRSLGLKLYQLKSLKFRSLKALLCRTKSLHQITYRLIGTFRIAKNIDWQNDYPVRVTAKRVTFCSIAYPLEPKL
ncbi:MAG: hypothetical protein KA716_28005 [Gloeotrichia echinulata DEX184]|nr:hypothetical protein [Gloeotrichia echinulata DEX184]